MELTNVVLIGGGIAGLLAVGAVAALFFVSRKSQKAMESMLLLLTRPERAKVQDAARVLQVIMSDEIQKIEASFKAMQDTLSDQIAQAAALEKDLGARNDALVELADDAAKKISQMSTRLENTAGGFQKVVSSKEWVQVEESCEQFQSRINELLSRIDSVSVDATQQAKVLQGHIDGWVESGKTLSQQLQSELESNTSQINSMVVESEAMQQKLTELSTSVAGGFADVKKEVADYENLMTANDKLLGKQLEKMDAFTKQSKKLLTSQLNNLTSTANAVGSQIRLAEASIEKREKGLTETITHLMESSQTTEGFIKTIASEVAGLSGKFQIEIRDFATGVVGELNTVHGVATTTLADTKTAAGAFSDSVRAMTEGVRETLIEMNAAHAQLTGQSQELVKVSSETTEQLRPLSELIEKYYSALPELTRGSAEMTSQLGGEIESLDTKIRELAIAVEKSILGIADSSLKLEHLSGQSRQQMIDLLSDYAKATDTMQTLNRQMTEARAAAPMAAVANHPSPRLRAAGAPAIPAGDFIKYTENIMEKLHELSVDLTRAVGAEIPAAVWNKYHSGDRTIFSKWFAKMLGAADKRKIRELFKNDAVFRSQATQFVRGFAKMMAGAEQTDNKEMVSATLLKTDLGQMYLALKSNL
ncbi:MAG: hypothetical protein FWF97_03190 [Alphaproteobacteria bacterium]|nr:hypothetical protein [Alphaproteobacteria bacterium]